MPSSAKIFFFTLIFLMVHINSSRIFNKYLLINWLHNQTKTIILINKQVAQSNESGYMNKLII
jgi:hypothetical protein